jgi:serine phosphatase RsbU (regulator of sigma subunit)
VDGLRKRLPDNGSVKPTFVAAAALDKELLSVRDDLSQMLIKSNEDSLAYPQKVDSKLAGLAMAVGVGTDSAPTAAEYEVFDKLKKQADISIAHWAEIQRTSLANFQKMVAGQNIQAIVVPAVENAGAAGESPK